MATSKCHTMLLWEGWQSRPPGRPKSALGRLLWTLTGFSVEGFKVYGSQRCECRTHDSLVDNDCKHTFNTVPVLPVRVAVVRCIAVAAGDCLLASSSRGHTPQGRDPRGQLRGVGPGGPPAAANPAAPAPQTQVQVAPAHREHLP